MDAGTKAQLKLKFYRLTLQLNAVILLAAFLVMALFKAPEPFRIPVIVTLIVVIAYLSVNFYFRYHETKAWLDEHAKKEPE
jgi:uncharacterized membrane protein YkvI